MLSRVQGFVGGLGVNNLDIFKWEFGQEFYPEFKTARCKYFANCEHNLKKRPDIIKPLHLQFLVRCGYVVRGSDLRGMV
jgi:hypothetical protein